MHVFTMIRILQCVPLEESRELKDAAEEVGHARVIEHVTILLSNRYIIMSS